MTIPEELRAALDAASARKALDLARREECWCTETRKRCIRHDAYEVGWYDGAMHIAGAFYDRIVIV